jgi:hypothetical protein
MNGRSNTSVGSGQGITAGIQVRLNFTSSRCVMANSR